MLTSRFPYPLEKGDKLRIYYQLKELSKNHQVTLITLCDKEPSPSDIQKLETIVDSLCIFRINKLTRILQLGRSLFTDSPFRNAYFYQSQIRREILKVFDQVQPDHIHCHLIRMADYVKDIPVKKTLDYMDSFSDGLLKRVASDKGLWKFFYKMEAERTARYEKRIYHSFDGFSIISDQDLKSLPLPEKDRIIVVKNGIDISFFDSKKEEKEFDLLFVGNLGYYPNVHAAQYIATKITPLLPDLNVLIAGARPSPKVTSLASDQIVIKPWLEDIRDAYDNARIFVAPLFVGIGQQNKILEAMAMGVVCITTTLVNNAINAKEGEEILIANTPEEFVQQIKSLNSDPKRYKQIKENARKFVVAHCSWDKATQPLIDLIEGRN